MLETTAGLRALAVALPRWRVERSLIAEAWGRRGSPGARPVCGHDEDSLTLCCDALAAVRRSTAGIVLCASTTAPHAERASSAVLVRALRLPDSVLATDVSGTARAGTAAALQAGAWARDGAEVLLAAADRRDAEPGSDLEALLGDAGAAACIGPAAAGDLA